MSKTRVVWIHKVIWTWTVARFYASVLLSDKREVTAKITRAIWEHKIGRLEARSLAVFYASLLLLDQRRFTYRSTRPIWKEITS